MNFVPAEEIEIGQTYLSKQDGFAWRFEVLGRGPKRIRVTQRSTRGGFPPRGRLLTPEQWNAFACIPEREG